MSDLPRFVQVNEEGPREGFQFEKQPISTERKVELIDRLSECGLTQIQIVSFVNPARVPGMADADEVVRRFRRKEGVRYTGLWLNDVGFQRALASGRLEVSGGISLTASEAFLKRNQRMSMRESIERAQDMVDLYRRHGVAVERGAIMAAFGCNFEGDIPVRRVLDLLDRLMEIVDRNAIELKTLTLADTMAWASPQSVKRVVGEVRGRYPELSINLHLHDTRGLALANAYAGLEMGVAIFDAAVAGLGGCPFAAHAGAAGNLCTEDFVFMLHEIGIETGIDLERLIETARFAEEVVGHPLPGSVKEGGSLEAFRSRS